MTDGRVPDHDVPYGFFRCVACGHKTTDIERGYAPPCGADEERVEPPRTPSILLLGTEFDLRDHLDDLNEAGERPIAVGIDQIGAPFLITLVGPYAEDEDVLFDSPWQSDISYGERVDGKWVTKPPHCDDCMAQVHAIKHLRFPVTVMVPSSAK